MSDIENLAGDTRPIGVFDSGLGGLTVARAIATALPHESVYYFGDTKRCPYGTRTEDEVRSFALQAGRWLSKHDVKIMVIACNTATAAALRLAQQVLDVPVIGVIAPGARAAINSTRTRRVGVLATNLTIRSGAYTRAIQDLDAGVDVYGCPASSFVEVVEHELASGTHLQEQWLENEDIFDTPAVRALVGATVEPLYDHGIDTVVVQGLNRSADQRAHGGRIKNVLVLEPLLLQMRARCELMLDDLDKTRGRAAVHINTGIQILDRARIGARTNGEVGGEHAHAARAGAVDGSSCARCDHTDDGDIEHLLGQTQGRSGRRIAGDDHDLDVVLRQPTARLQRKRAHLVLGAGAVGATLGVTKVIDGLMRKRRCNRARDRQTTQTRVEHTDRARIPGQILDIGHYLTRFSLEKMWLRAMCRATNGPRRAARPLPPSHRRSCRA